MYFDTHAHYDDEMFEADRTEVLTSMPLQGVELILNPGCDIASSRTAISLAEEFGFVFAAVGIHPQSADRFSNEDIGALRALAAHPKVRAIGEVGLDYYYDDGAPRNVQLECLENQMSLACELGLPVIIHDRDATADCIAVVRQFPDVRGVFHCFSGSWETAEILIDCGWYLSFTGAVTFKNARRAPEAAAMIPLERLMLETDAPYLAPVPRRGERCDSSMLAYTAARIASLRGIELAELAAVTMENGKRLFGIKL